MTDRDHTADQRECGGDVAAYALGALDATEVDAFRRHLETCAVCKDELASFQRVVDELPLAAPRHRAPSSVRRRVLREAAADARRRGRPAPRGASALGRWAVPRPLLALGAALLVAVGVVVAVQAGSSGGTRVVRAQVVGPGSAQLRIAHGHGSLVLHHFAPPPAGKIYEVWVKRGSAPPSPTSALFGVTSSGSGDVDVPGSLKGVSIVMVTPEPPGGSPQPTHAPVITVSLT
jgi:anti-sigma-K factor RskA